MSRYYTDRLAAGKLLQCYRLAPPATRAYLEGEIEFVLGKLSPADRVLELGCGYGRVLRRLLAVVPIAWGIDTSAASLALAREHARAANGDRPANGRPAARGGSPAGERTPSLSAMDAARLAFRSASFDVIVCIQNGISAFGVDRLTLMREALRVARPGGRLLFSSYAERFWPERLRWFEIQAAHGLIGEIDHTATGNGVIVCKDGFRATTVGAEEFSRLAGELGVTARIEEVAGSSVFCEILAP